MVGSADHENVPSGSIKGREFLLLKNSVKLVGNPDIA
jgi:hypothetical protein